MNIDLRFMLSAALIAFGLFFEVTAVIGVFRFKNALARLHAAALGDTMGLLLILAGLAVAAWQISVSLKLIAVAVLFWCASPVVSHMIARLELKTNPDIEKEMHTWKR